MDTYRYDGNIYIKKVLSGPSIQPEWTNQTYDVGHEIEMIP
jgi:hypothetical protein